MKEPTSKRNSRQNPQNKSDRSPNTKPSPSSSSSPSSPSPSNLANLHELTERIADLLQVGSLNKNPIHCPKDTPLGYLSATTHVAVIFSKHLIRDQVTVEHAKRIVTFVKQIASGALNPDVICFAGGSTISEKSFISEAAAGYSFFRSICEEANVDVSRFDFILEEQGHNTKENLRNVIEELRRRSGSDAVTACHFTLVSSDYHLIRMQEVHRLSPRQSVLFPLEVSSATWNCIFAAYPFCVSRDAATAFLGRVVVLANDLGILLVNLNGAIDDREFISRENLHRLNETFAKMREMYRVIGARTTTRGGFRTDMRKHAETLEMAIHDMREVQTLLSPLQEVGSSVPRADLAVARNLLANTISKMRSSMDPDRVLRVHDRLAIVDDMVQFVASECESQTSLPPPNDVLDSDLPSLGDLQYSSEFDESDRRRKARNSNRIQKTTMPNEVTWRGGVNFQGNGKKIARDGPNVVIITESAAPIAKTTSAKRGRSRRVAAACVDGEAVAGSFGAQMTQTGSRSGPAASTGRGRAGSKTQQTSTATKKRKTAKPRKLATPSGAESA